MNDKKFQAILAKNMIAREVRDYYHNGAAMSPGLINSMLEDIEEYLGTGNQPSVVDIVNDPHRQL